MRVLPLNGLSARRFGWRSPVGPVVPAAPRPPRRLTALVTVTAVIYLIHAVALGCGATVHAPGMNPPHDLGALAATLVGLAAYAVLRGRRFTQGEATAMLVLQVAAAVTLSHSTVLDLAALTNGLGMSMLGAYASWLLGWPGAVAFYAGLSAWVGVVAARGEAYLTLAAIVLAVQAAVTAEIVRSLRRRVRRLTHLDPLTGTLNRRGVEETARVLAARNSRRGTPVCVALIDLDNLREVNNTAGHLAGDALLETAAGEWRRALARAPVSIGRIGGDEFVLLFDGVDEIAAREMVARLRTGSGVSWTAGVAEMRSGETFMQALAGADLEMYAHKGTNGSGPRLFRGV